MPQRGRAGLSIQQAFLLTTTVWVTVPLFGALPFLLGETDLGFVDALFEAMSGVTTTGTTVIAGLDDLPSGLLLWRGLLQWLGGLGIVIVALVFLPEMRVGGMQFFRSEGFDTFGKALPRTIDISKGVINVYLVLTAVCALAYLTLGMGAFDAVVHALTTVATGGFSTRDASFSGYPAGVQYASVLFMILATLPFVRLMQGVQGHLRPLLADTQVQTYLRWIGYALVLVILHELLATGRLDEAGAAHPALQHGLDLFGHRLWRWQRPDLGQLSLRCADRGRGDRRLHRLDRLRDQDLPLPAHAARAGTAGAAHLLPVLGDGSAP